MRLALFFAALAGLLFLAAAAPNHPKPDCHTTKKTSTFTKPKTSSHKTSTWGKSTSTSKTSVKTTSTSTKKVSSSTKTSTSSTSKVSSTSVKSTASSSSTSSSSVSSSSSSTVTTTSISIPTLTIPTVTIPTSTSSSSSSSTSSSSTSATVPGLPTTGCKPVSGEAIRNGGFGDGLANYEYFTDKPDDDPAGVVTGFGLLADEGNQNSLIFQGPGDRVTFTIAQTTCLVVGQPYIYSYHLGIFYNTVSPTSSTDCTVGLSTSDGQTLVPEVPPCGGPVTPADQGTCTEQGDLERSRYGLFTGPYAPLTDQITFTFSATCQITNSANAPGLLDLFSVVPAVG